MFQDFGTTFVFALVFAAIVVIFRAIKFVPQGYAWTVERFGQYVRTLKPGLAFINPVFDRIGRKMSMMETVLDIPSQEVITKDNAQVTADAIAFIQVIDAARAAYEVQNLMQAIANLALTNVRTVIGSMDLDEVLSKRDDINIKLLRVVDAATQPWGVKVTRIEIKDLSPPSDITESMARQMKAERERRAEVLTADGQKQAEILRAEGSKQAAILEAEGRREAAFRDAEARERLAEAEAKATQLVSDAIAKGDVQAINYFLGQKYVEAFKELATAPNQKFVVLPMEATGLLGSIAGIGELAKVAAERGALATAARAQQGSVPPATR